MSKLVANYGWGELCDRSTTTSSHEANLLMLDINKAKFILDWRPRMNLNQAIAMTMDWYRNYRSGNVYGICTKQIECYTATCVYS